MEDKKQKKRGWSPQTVFLLLIGVLLAAKIIFDFSGFRDFISEAAGFLLSIVSYLLVGFVIAYVLNAYMMVWEKHVFKNMKRRRLKKALCIIISYVTFLGFMAFLIFSIVPTLVDTISSLTSTLPGQIEKALKVYQDLMEGKFFDLPDSVNENIKQIVISVQDTLLGFVNVDRITALFATTANSIFNFIMGVIVSVYMLIEKNRVIVVCNRVVDAIFSRSKADKIKWGGHQINNLMKQYFTGKLLQAFIILIISYIAFTIAGIDYAILFAVIMGFTNMIPYIGPWIGAVPVVLVSVVTDVWLGVAALICVLSVQAIDNFFITPKVVGGRMGISPLLVLIGLCIGGSLFGLPGMIMGDVMAAVFKVFFYDTYIEKRIRGKKAAGELPEGYGGPPAAAPPVPADKKRRWFKK